MASDSSGKYIIFLDLHLNIQSKISRVKKKYSPNSFKRWPAHITLKYEEYYLISQPEIIEIVRNFFSKIPILKLTLDKPVISFLKQAEGWNINIPVKIEGTLRKLTKKLSKKMEPFIDINAPGAVVSTKWEQSNDFSPHISINGGLDSKLGRQTYLEVINENFQIDFPLNIECQSMTLAKWENKKWRRVSRIKLCSQNEKV